MKGIAIRAGVLVALVAAIIWHASSFARSRDAAARPEAVVLVGQAR